MTLNLQTVLALIGVVIVIVIYLVSKWQSRSWRSPQAAEQQPARQFASSPVNFADNFGEGESQPRYEQGHDDHSDDHGGDYNDDRSDDHGGDYNDGHSDGHEDEEAAETWSDISPGLGHNHRPEPIPTPWSQSDQPVDDSTIPSLGSNWLEESTPVFGTTTDPAPVQENVAQEYQDQEYQDDVQEDDQEYVQDDGHDDVQDNGQEETEFHNRHIEDFVRLSQIDYWVKITGQRDVGRETVLALYREGTMEFSTGNSKARSIYGLKTPERDWCNVEDEAEDSRFTDLVVTIQLADANGPISEHEMNLFSALVSRLSEGTGRELVRMASVENALAQANAISEFVRHFDAVFEVHISPREDEYFYGAAIDRGAQQMGMERDDKHHYSRFKSVGKGQASRVALYSLIDLSDSGQFDFDNTQTFTTDGLTFATRPAVNRSPGAAFAEMVDSAKAFASRIDGVVRSVDHEDLSDDEIDRTRESIDRMAAEMEQLGIPAGSDEAVRLF